MCPRRPSSVNGATRRKTDGNVHPFKQLSCEGFATGTSPGGFGGFGGLLFDSPRELDLITVADFGLSERFLELVPSLFSSSSLLQRHEFCEQPRNIARRSSNKTKSRPLEKTSPQTFSFRLLRRICDFGYPIAPKHNDLATHF